MSTEIRKFDGENEPGKENIAEAERLKVEDIVETENRMLTMPNQDTALWFPIPQEGEVNYEARINLNEIHITEQYVEAIDRYLDQALSDFTGFSQARCEGFVVPLSGGIDSSVVTKLLQRYCNQKGCELKVAIMGEGDHDTDVKNYRGTPAEWIDIQYAKLMCAELGIKFEYLDISEDLQALRKRYITSWARAGQRSRARANHMYAMGEEHDLISVGSTNGSEFILAAFSTGGPAGNIAPLLDLYKTEVYAIARDIGIPKYIQERKSLISELNIADYSLYGGGMVDSAIIDPIIRRLWFKKEKPEQVATELRHSARWIMDINEKRIKGETCRRNYKGLIINRGYKFEDIQPDLVIDRSYFI